MTLFYVQWCQHETKKNSITWLCVRGPTCPLRNWVNKGLRSFTTTFMFMSPLDLGACAEKPQCRQKEKGTILAWASSMTLTYGSKNTKVAILLFYVHANLYQIPAVAQWIARNEKLTSAGSCNCDWVYVQSKCCSRLFMPVWNMPWQ